MGRVLDGVATARERKVAAGLHSFIPRSEAEAKAVVRRIFVGFDIDVDELWEVRSVMGQGAAALTFAGIPAVEVGGTAWIDGLIVGLILGEKTAR